MGLTSSNHQVLQNWASLTPDRSRNSPFKESRIHLPSITIPKRSQNSELLGTKHVFCWFTIGFIVVLPPGCTSTPFNGSFSVLWHETATLSAQHAVKACFVPWGFKNLWGPTYDVVVDAVQGSCMVQIGTLGLAFKDWIFFEKVFSFPSHIFWKTLGLNNMEPNFRDYCAYYVSCCVETHLPTIEKPWSIEFGTCTSQESIPIDQRGKNIGNTTVNTIY